MEIYENIFEFIEKKSPENWKIKCFFENDPPVLFKNVPKTSGEIHLSIQRYLNQIKSCSVQPFYVAETSDAIIACHNQSGSLSALDKSGCIFKDISTKYDFGGIENNEEIDIGGQSVLLSMDSGSNYFHWMCQVLPRIKLLNEYGCNWRSVDAIFLPKNQAPFIDQTLKILDIPIEKIKHLEPNKTYTFDNLLIPSKPNRHIHLAHWTIDFLKSSFLQGENLTQNKKIYISRRSNVGRCIENDAEVWELLSQKNYERIYLEDYSVLDQAKLFNSSSEIVSAHGAALTNLIFCKKNTKLIELFNPSYFLALYWNMCNILDLDYYYIIGEGDNLGKEKGKNQNIKINIEEFKKILQV